MPQFSDKEQNDYYNSQPAKRIGAAAWLEDAQGRVLIAKPTYKKGWTLIGGLTETNESPLDAAIRETHEEIGIKLTPDRFMLAGYRYVTARNGRSEDSQLYFKAQLTDKEIASIRLQTNELSEYVFVKSSELSNYADTPRMQAVIAAMQNKFPFYVQNETRVI